MNIGILELMSHRGAGLKERAIRYLHTRQCASIMPQAVSVWCRQMGHRVHYATYYGNGDPKSKLPEDLDIVFISAYTFLAPLAYALAKLFRGQGVHTVIGGPHARSYPQHCLRHFDHVVLECNKGLIADILGGEFRPGTVLRSSEPFDDMPSIEERLPEIRTSAFAWGRSHAASFIPMLGSAGCPYACDFCVDWNSRYRTLSLDRLGEDLRFASRHLPSAKLAFHDPNFGIRFEDTIAQFEAIPAGRRNAYGFETSLSNLKRDRLARLRATNCVAVIPGIESWSGYGNKAGTGDATLREKLDKVVDHCSALAQHVPYLQANFVLGIDADSGDEPFELTREFVRRLPAMRPIFNIPVAYGATPLHDALQREGRLLAAMPFTFHTSAYLTLVLKNYDPVTYMRKMVGLFRMLTKLLGPVQL